MWGMQCFWFWKNGVPRSRLNYQPRGTHGPHRRDRPNPGPFSQIAGGLGFKTHNRNSNIANDYLQRAQRKVTADRAFYVFPPTQSFVWACKERYITPVKRAERIAAPREQEIFFRGGEFVSWRGVI